MLIGAYDNGRRIQLRLREVAYLVGAASCLMLWVEVVVVEYKPLPRLLAKPTFACGLGLNLRDSNLGSSGRGDIRQMLTYRNHRKCLETS